MPKVLVTGGSGFIGTHLVEALAASGHEVTNLDIKAPTFSRHEKYWRRLNLMDAAGVDRLIADIQPEIIYNLAAIANISVSADALLPNTQGLRHLLGAARGLERLPRIVHVSTQLVLKAGYAPTGPRDYAPYTPYGESKAASEEILWNEADDFCWTTVRPTNVWGPWHATFPESTWKYINRRWYMLPSDSDPIRSYGYIANVVAQVIAAGCIEQDRVNRKIFYVGDETMVSSRWLDGFSKALTGRPIPRIPTGLLKLLAIGGEFSGRIGGPSPINMGRLYRLTTDYRVPMGPTFETLGRGSVSLEAGISETVEWLRHHLPTEFRRK